MMSSQLARQRAELAAQFLRDQLSIPEGCIGLMLGTGWGDALQLDTKLSELPFEKIQGFGALQKIEGHARRLEYGQIANRDVVLLRGRVHVNEHPTDPVILDMVRLQVEMLIQLGVRNVIVTSAAGSLDVSKKPVIKPGTVVVVDGFVTLFSPPMPLYAGEFCSPEDTLDAELRNAALQQIEFATRGVPSKKVKSGGFAMVRGPFFEGRRYDKRALRATGAAVVGMSMLPEACVIALYPGVRMLGLAYVSNTATEDHSHKTNCARAKTDAEFLADVLRRATAVIPK